ncbi:MAG: AMP-binding protein [Sneathiella sp.]|nr:AMP-binding protein [Sneathiella sp.]
MGKEKNFKQFRDEVSAMKARLSMRGVTSVVLAATSSYSFSVGFLAGLHAGCRIVIPPNSLPGMLDHFVTEVCPLLGDVPTGRGDNHILLNGETAEGGNFTDLDPKNCHLDFYTSGSTGNPKRVGKRLSQIEDELIILHETFGAQLGTAATLGTVSHQHIYGLYFKAFLPLCEGRPFFPGTFEIWEELLAAAPPGACFVSSPAHLSRIPPREPLAGDMQPPLIFSAGGPLGFEAACHAAEVFGTIPTEIYGSTETGGVAYRQQKTATTPFVPLPGNETRVDGAGLLSVKSNYTDGGDWDATNDIAERFDDGSFLLTGRANQFVKIEGKRVSLAEVEKFLCSSDLVRDAAVLVLHDARQSLSAIVELTELGWQRHADLGAFRLSRHLRRQLSRDLENAAMPRRWRFVRRLPVNAQGKHLQQALHELFTDKGPAD